MLATADYAIIGGYLALMVVMGLLITSKIKKYRDYFLAGGMLTTPLLVCTLVSTYYDLDVTVATSERGFYNGLAAWFWWSRPYYVCIFIAAFLVVKRFKTGAFMSLPDILEHHYGKWTRAVGATACLVYCLPVAAMAGLSSMFQVMGWSREAGLAISIGVCGAYTVMGGLWADALTDTVQFLLMCVSIAVAVPIALHKVGGFSFTSHLPAAHMTATGGANPWLIAAWCAGALTVFVEPSFYQRIFAAKDAKSVTRALLIGLFLWAAYDWAVTLIGMIARSAVAQGLLSGDLEGKRALLAVCITWLPIGLKGFFVAGVLAAAMSSVDTYSLLASANIVYDIYRPIFKPDISDKLLILLTRIGVFAVMIAGAAVSLAFRRVSDAWVFMAGAMTSVVFVPIMGALFGKPARAAGLAASAAGLSALIVFHVVIHSMGRFDDFEESYVWEIGRMQIWREYAVFFALPVSAAVFMAVNGVKKWKSALG